jgi:flagellar basal-body rod protein FlgG
LAQPGVETAQGDQRPTGLYVGLGVKVSGTQLDMSQGPAIVTERPLDVMIEGRGFFRVQVGSDEAPGGIAYTRAGNFTLNSDGEIVMATDQGRRLEPIVTIPEDAIEVSVSTDGRIFYLAPGDTDPTEAGQFELATFINPWGLSQMGDNLFGETVASGPPITGQPGEQQFGLTRGGMLEGSNVDPTIELINLIQTQRAFEMNSQSIRTADETLQVITQLRTG